MELFGWNIILQVYVENNWIFLIHILLYRKSLLIRYSRVKIIRLKPHPMLPQKNPNRELATGHR